MYKKKSLAHFSVSFCKGLLKGDSLNTTPTCTHEYILLHWDEQRSHSLCNSLGAATWLQHMEASAAGFPPVTRACTVLLGALLLVALFLPATGNSLLALHPGLYDLVGRLC